MSSTFEDGKPEEVVAVGVGVHVGKAVCVSVAVGIGVKLGNGVNVEVGVKVGMGVAVSVGIKVGDGVSVGESVFVGVGVIVDVPTNRTNMSYKSFKSPETKFVDQDVKATEVASDEIAGAHEPKFP